MNKLLIISGLVITACVTVLYFYKTTATPTQYIDSNSLPSSSVGIADSQKPIIQAIQKHNLSRVAGESINHITPTPVLQKSETFIYSGWIPSWASVEGNESLSRHHKLLDSISPVWYAVNEDGSLRSRIPSNSHAIKYNAKTFGTKMIPSIAMFDHELFTKVLQNETNFNRHIESIITEVDKHGYDGIDLDYESTKLDDKVKYFEFIEILSSKLRSRNKLLSISVIAKWGDNIEYGSLPETRKVQDWTRLAEYADEIRIMAYDYTYSGSKHPGPIAPYQWIENILKYAVTKAPSHKFVLGVHLYSYEWWQEADAQPENQSLLHFDPDTFKQPFANINPPRSYTYGTIKKVLSENKGELAESWNEKIFKYTKTNSTTKKLENRVLVYIDPQGVEDRIELAKKYGIGGVAFWRLGGESELLKDLEK